MDATSREGNSSATPKRQCGRATPAQILRQVAVIILVLAIWSVLLVAYLGLTQPGEEPTVSSPQPTEAVAVSTPTDQSTATDAVAAPTSTEPPTPTEAVPAVDSPVPPEQTAAATATQLPTQEPEPTQPPPAPTATATSAEVTEVSFSKDVLPILSTRCERCHGGQRTEAGLSLSSHADVIAGSDDGPVVVPGSATTSRLVEVIISGDMPRRAPRLPDAEIQTISDWVDAGAPDN